MNTSLDKFRAKLVIKILYAGSLNELKRFIEAAVKSLRKEKVESHYIAGFIDKVLHQLEFIISSTTDALKLGNLTNAKNFLQHTRQQITLA